LYDAGFRYIDLEMYSFTPDCPYMGENWRDEVQKIKDLADSLGMRFVQAHSQGGNPLSEDKAHADFVVQATIRSIEICEMLGIKNTVVHVGWIDGFSKEESFAKNKAFYEKLLPTAERCGVNVLCENGVTDQLPGTYYPCTGKDLREFIEYVNHPLFHGCWDTGHGNCEGSQYDEILALGEHLYAIHYNDNRGDDDVHIAPYFGTLNHDEVLNALIDVGYQGYFTLESNGSLRRYNAWTGHRRRYEKTRLAEPQLFMQRHVEKLLYDTSKWMLSEYGLLEEETE
jgi:sugar phosphate isomerase/epimerase